jgi:hypothetical protein
MITMISNDHAKHVDDRLTHGGLVLRSIAQIIAMIGHDHHGDRRRSSRDPRGSCDDRP